VPGVLGRGRGVQSRSLLFVVVLVVIVVLVDLVLVVALLEQHLPILPRWYRTLPDADWRDRWQPISGPHGGLPFPGVPNWGRCAQTASFPQSQQ
jgi:hypothetical protein